MIKGIRFVTRRAGATPGELAQVWPTAVAAVAQAPPDVRPSRIVLCTTLPGLPDPVHDGVEIGWFADADHLRRFRGWVGTPRGGAVLSRLDRVVDSDASPVVVAEEAVLRGAAWLDRRWRAGGVRFKHMAVAVRAADLTSAEFSARWRDHAGRVRGPGAERQTPIPEAVRGQAYVQSHPYVRKAGEWAYDAVNEVYFDDLAGLRTRIAWFAENVPDGADPGLFGRSAFLAVREEVVPLP
ncbi:hypothetical protein [Actinocorallia populi]|uniref:hypothetical protein n=1 Tax=Actinocorallia populi TaxID=2079200 RepID=UPI000D092295|nr:hypothetical protein [Actinocorallia populi]